MPKLAIIDQAVSAGGDQRFLQGLVEGLYQQPDIEEWDITLLLSHRNSGGYEVEWPQHLNAPNLHIEKLQVSTFWRRFLNRTADPQPVLRMPGSISAQRIARSLVVRFAPLTVLDYQTRARCWIEKFCTDRRFDLVYFGWPYFLECPRLSAPIVCTPHDFNFKHFAWEDVEARNVVDTQMAGWIEKAAELVVSSNFIADELRLFYPDFAHKAHVVRLGIPRSGCEPSPSEVEECRSRLGLPREFVLLAGWLSPHKNPKVVFEAIRKLKDQGVKIALVCTGPKSDQLKPGNNDWKTQQMRSIIEEIKRLGLVYGEDYFALGYVSEFDLDCIYRMASLLVVASLYEAGSFPAREAMLAGCPVVMSRIPALEEEFELLQGNACLFDPNSSDDLCETIRRVLAAPGEAAEKARQAALIAPRVFSWKGTGEGYMAVFRQALKNSGWSPRG